MYFFLKPDSFSLSIVTIFYRPSGKFNRSKKFNVQKLNTLTLLHIETFTVCSECVTWWYRKCLKRREYR